MEIDAFVRHCALPAGNSAAPEARLIDLLDCMQDAAGIHADSLGAGIRTLMEKGLTWVLARLHVRCAPLPARVSKRPRVDLAVWTKKGLCPA